MGATLRTGVRLGRDVTLEKLRAENDAVVLAIGAWKGRTLRIPGEDHPAVLSGIDFLRDVNAGKPVTVGKIVAVIGGGNTALDAARCSLRRGAAKVTMYYRRTREEMPASDAEIEEALEEGIDIQYLAAPVSIQAEGDSLKTLTLLRMELGEPDASGRRRPVPVDGSEFSVPVDTIISAVGQYSDTKLLSGVAGLVDEKGNLKADLDNGPHGSPRGVRRGRPADRHRHRHPGHRRRQARGARGAGLHGRAGPTSGRRSSSARRPTSRSPRLRTSPTPRARRAHGRPSWRPRPVPRELRRDRVDPARRAGGASRGGPMPGVRVPGRARTAP